MCSAKEDSDTMSNALPETMLYENMYYQTKSNVFYLDLVEKYKKSERKRKKYKRENRKFRKKIRELREIVRYMPGSGVEYMKAKEEFETLSEKN